MSDDFMGPERNGRSSSGIVVDGVAYQLAGQPPLAQSHGWGDLGWALRARRAGVTQVSIFWRSGQGRARTREAPRTGDNGAGHLRRLLLPAAIHHANLRAPGGIFSASSASTRPRQRTSRRSTAQRRSRTAITIPAPASRAA